MTSDEPAQQGSAAGAAVAGAGEAEQAKPALPLRHSVTVANGHEGGVRNGSDGSASDASGGAGNGNGTEGGVIEGSATEGFGCEDGFPRHPGDAATSRVDHNVDGRYGAVTVRPRCGYEQRQSLRASRAEINFERRLWVRQAAGSDYKKHALRLLHDASRSGLCDTPSHESSEKELEGVLKRVQRSASRTGSNPDESELGKLYDTRRSLLSTLEKTKRQSRATSSALQDMVGFEGTVRRHYEKLKIAEHLKPAADTCPVCDSPTERGAAISEAIHHSMAVIRSESVAVENVRPRLIEHQDSLGMEIDRLNRQVNEVDERIKTWIRQSEEAKQLNTLAQYHANLHGKVSQFLEMNPTTPQPGADLSVLRDQIQSLEGQIDTEAKEKLRRSAERKVSEYLSEAFGQLPTVAPVLGLTFSFPPDHQMSQSSSKAQGLCCGCMTPDRTKTIWLFTLPCLSRCRSIWERLTRQYLPFLRLTRSVAPTTRNVEKTSRRLRRMKKFQPCARTSTSFLMRQLLKRTYRCC